MSQQPLKVANSALSPDQENFYKEIGLIPDQSSGECILKRLPDGSYVGKLPKELFEINESYFEGIDYDALAASKKALVDKLNWRKTKIIEALELRPEVVTPELRSLAGK